jgi:hypothetical protein
MNGMLHANSMRPATSCLAIKYRQWGFLKSCGWVSIVAIRDPEPTGTHAKADMQLSESENGYEPLGRDRVGVCGAGAADQLKTRRLVWTCVARADSGVRVTVRVEDMIPVAGHFTGREWVGVWRHGRLYRSC